MSSPHRPSEIVIRVSWGQIGSPSLSIGPNSADGSLKFRGSTEDALVRHFVSNWCRAISSPQTDSGDNTVTTGSGLICTTDTDASQLSGRTHSGSSMCFPRNTGAQIMTGNWASSSSGKNPQYLSRMSESHQSSQVS